MSSKQDTKFQEAFPAPSPRKHQKEKIEEIVEAFENGADVVQLSAPTGAGKSIMIHTAIDMLPGNGFFVTPLNALIDQIEKDEFIGSEVTVIKGRNNYECVHPADKGTQVDKAICQRDSSFECELKVEECPYYSKKYRALEHDEVVTNMAFLMAEGMVQGEVDHKLGNRNVLAVDECQSIESHALNFISFTISERTTPDDIWKNISIPDEDREDDMDHLIEWLEDEVLGAVGAVMEHLDGISLKSEEQVGEYDRVRQFKAKVDNFLSDIEDNDWVCKIETDIKKNSPNTKKAVFEPIRIGRFLDNLLWNRGEKIILSSATIPGGNWLNEIGLGDREVETVRVPSTFPVENRPIIMGHSVGKMTYNKRKENMPDAVEKVKQIAEHHEGQKGMVHCRGYNYIEMFRRAATNHGYGDWYRRNFHEQDRYNREESLEEWINNGNQVFMSVAMDEGIDLDGDKCRWQILLKTLYPNMQNKRISHRMEYMCTECDELKVGSDNDCPDCGTSLGDWAWYNSKAAIQVQQAYGRAVRSKEDEAVFYVLDSSAKKLIQMNADLFNRWFLEAIDDIRIDPSRGI